MDLVIGKASQFSDPGRKLVAVQGFEIGVFRYDGHFYAYENRCPHSGGPACQGKMLPLTLEAVQDDKTSSGRNASSDHMNIICPWHGMEFDMRTGEHPLSKTIRLRRIDVRLEGDDVYVTLPQRR